MSSVTNDDRPSWGAQTRLLDHHQPWPTWDSVPSSLADLQVRGPFFLELFAGKAGITEAVHLLGVPVLPPVDIALSDLVPTPSDVRWMLRCGLTSWRSLRRGWSFSCIVVPHVTHSLQLAS